MSTVESVTPELLAEHLAWCRLKNLRPSTVEQRRRTLVRVQRAVRTDLLVVTAPELEAWYAAVAVKVLPESRAADLSHVRQFYGWLQRTERRVDNPTLNLVRPRVNRRLPRPASEADVEYAISRAPERIKPWLCLAAYAGFRAMEIANLRRDDIMDTQVPQMLVVSDGKGGKQRVVPLAESVLTALRGHGLPARGWVFPRLDGQPGPNKPWLISSYSNEYFDSIGLDITLHQLRHRFGTRIYAESNDLRVTQELMGHSSPTTTAGYAAWSMGKAIKAVNDASPRRFHPDPDPVRAVQAADVAS